MTDPFDAVVVGGGHNGLAAAFYLARAGLRCLVLERRPFPGGACVTETFAPGFRASPGAYVLSMLRPSIWRDMGLAARGLRVDAAGPTLNLYTDDAHLWTHSEPERTAEDVKRFSPADARALPDFEGRLATIARALTPTFDRRPPDPRSLRLRDLRTLWQYAVLAARNRGVVQDAAFLFTTSATQLLSEHFESEHLKAAIGWHAINDSTAGPSTPGSAYVVLHDHAAEGGSGQARRWGFVRGGIGTVVGLMADAARDAGAVIRCDAEVERIVTRRGRAVGVLLSTGEEILASRILSNADPKRTFLQLCDPDDLPAWFLRAIRAYRSEGTSIKMNLALAGLPHVRGMDGKGPQAYHRGIMELHPFLDDLDRQQADARAGVAADPAHIELCFPTVHDPSLAPEGKHVMTIDINSQPYSLAEGTWADIREARADRAIEQIGRHFPDLPDLIEHRQVLTPFDMEQVLGLTGGHALHGEMAADQLFFLRPVRGYAGYRTPIDGLYLCGAGAHPGGGVSGAPGRNCAREVLHDSRR